MTDEHFNEPNGAGNDIGMGEITQQMRRDAISGSMTSQQAVEYLKRDARFRTVGEILCRLRGLEAQDRDEAKRWIVDTLLLCDPSKRRDSTDRKVCGWLGNNTYEISRESALMLIYAMKLPMDRASDALTLLSGESFHWRDPVDIVWIYGIINGLDYPSAKALLERLRKKGLLDIPKKVAPEARTRSFRLPVAQLRTEEELEDFLESQKGRLGQLHNTAFELFESLMKLLREPEQNRHLPEERHMSVREVLATYMYNDYIPRAHRVGQQRAGVAQAVLSALQRNIARNWPDESTISRMQHRKVDVTRKVMILLFLATDGGESAYAGMADLKPEEVFEDLERRMNAMLKDCGFGKLDSRVPFDWMILYCMCADESIFVDDNVREFLENLFSGPERPDDED